MKPLLDLIKYGQSYWLANLTRTMLKNGALHKRVETQGLRGVTSNPAIFQKAISAGTDYDTQIVQLRIGQITALFTPSRPPPTPPAAPPALAGTAASPAPRGGRAPAARRKA